MWRTWIKIGIKDQLTPKMFQDTIRQRMFQILQLLKQNEISWFYFLYHEKDSDPANAYFDVIFTTDKKDPSEFLPEFCVSTAKISPMTSISGISEVILKEGDIRHAWWLIGEISKFLINFICAHTENKEIPPGQISQFMHFFMNPLFLGHRSLFFPRGDPTQIKYLLAQLPYVPGGLWGQF